MQKSELERLAKEIERNVKQLIKFTEKAEAKNLCSDREDCCNISDLAFVLADITSSYRIFLMDSTISQEIKDKVADTIQMICAELTKLCSQMIIF